MGYPFFSYWNHTVTGGRTDIVLAEDLSDLQVTPIRDVSDGLSMRGSYRRTTGRPSVRVRIVLERFTSRELFRKFSAMINHLERGGWVAFGVDDTKAYGAQLRHNHDQGDRALHVGPNMFNDYTPNSASTTSLTASTSAPYGDELIIESPPPIAAREYFATYSVTPSGSDGKLIRIDASGGGTTDYFLGEDYPEGSMVRYSDFWPKLFLPAGSVGGALLTHEHRIAYTLDLALEYVIPMMNYLEDPPDQPEAADDPNEDNPGPGDSSDGDDPQGDGSNWGDMTAVLKPEFGGGFKDLPEEDIKLPGGDDIIDEEPELT